MNMKLVGLLVAVVIILLGLLVMMVRAKPEAPVAAPVAVTTPEKPAGPRPGRGGSYTKTPPGKYEYTTPK